MDRRQGNEQQPQGMRASSSDLTPYGMVAPYQPNQMMGTTPPSSVGPFHSRQTMGPPSFPAQQPTQGMGASSSDPAPYGMVAPYQPNQMMGTASPSLVGPIHSSQTMGPPSFPAQQLTQGMGASSSDPTPYGMVAPHQPNQMMGTAPPSSVGPIHSSQTMGPPSSPAQQLTQGMGASSSDPTPYGMGAPYQPNQMIGTAPPSSVGSIHSPQTMGPPSSTAQQLTEQQQHAYQHLQQKQQLQQQLQQLLRNFWTKQLQDVERTNDFKNHNLPLARIKKIMKADEDVRMIAAEAPVIFARACEMFILELTLRAWNHTEENKRRTLQKNDISAAITRTDVFDFLIDIIPREDMCENVLAASIPGGPFTFEDPTEVYPYYYLPQQPVGPPGMFVGAPDQGFYAQQQQQQQLPYIAQQIWPQLEYQEEQEEEQPEQQQSLEDSPEDS